MKELFYINFFLIIFNFNPLLAAEIFESCNSVHGNDLTSLSGTWETHFTTDAGLNEVYSINFCGGLQQPDGCQGSAVCLTQNHGAATHLSYGDSSAPPSVNFDSRDSVGFYLEFNTSRKCSESTFYRSSITFDCAKTLGSPEVIASDDCFVDILWETNLACRVSNALNQTKCYAYDSGGAKRDLETLAKQEGFYFIGDPATPSAANHDGIYINVCRNVYSEFPSDLFTFLSQCPTEASACLLKDGRAYGIGVAKQPLAIGEEDRLTLTYTAGAEMERPLGCSRAQVVVTFVCPGGNRGGSRKPILTSSDDCQYAIEWWTEAACPSEFLSSHSCQLDLDRHGVDLDLSTLTKSGGNYKVVTGDDEKTEYFLNVCSSTGVQCGSDQSGGLNSVCQIRGESDSGKVAGKVEGFELKYFDDELSLVYKNGDKCGNGLKRNSIILFHCNQSAGIGSPTFNHELHCTYYFDWHSSHACVAPPPSCHITDSAGSSYDLSSLTRVAGNSNWEVVNRNEENTKYFINICGEIIHNTLTTGCPTGAAVCEKNEDKFQSFGLASKFNLTKVHDTLVLWYTGGGKCGEEKTRSTKLTLFCKPGATDSSPVVSYVSPDTCVAHLTWHTSAACPVKAIQGSGCQVKDDVSGLVFDLKELTKSTEMYQIKNSGYNFYLNVCGPLFGTPCGENAAICQVENEGQKRAFTLGRPSSNLNYYNGFVNLTYTDGTKYGNGISRKAQISFLCDEKAGRGKPEYLKEADHTYVFNWYTSLVCPSIATQCFVDDPGTGAQFDLSPLSRSTDDPTRNYEVIGDDVTGHGKRKYYLNICRVVNIADSSNNCADSAGSCEVYISENGEESTSVSNLGQPKGPSIEDGNLVLTYLNGNHCTENVNYTTKIHFVCQEGATTSAPRFLSRENCIVSFIWNTASACPLNKQSNNGEDNGEDNGGVRQLCEVTDTASQFSYNLSPLSHPPNQPYVVQAGNGFVYDINICGPVESCSARQLLASSGCQRETASHAIDHRVANHSVVTLSNEGEVTVQYRSRERNSDGNFESFTITLTCDRNQIEGDITLGEVSGGNTQFDMRTALSCPPQPVECSVIDDLGNKFDLSPLTSRFWTVLDDGEGQPRSFRLGVCKPLSGFPSCPAESSGACMLSHSGNDVIGTNLGVVQSNPVVTSNSHTSSITLHYHNGDKCESDPTSRYSTRILLECSTEDNHIPVFQPNNANQCEFYFIWETPAACPIRAVTHPDCRVTDPLYHLTYDITKLTRDTDYVIDTDTEWKFQANICSNLKQGIGTCKSAAVCQVSKSAPTSRMHSAGEADSTLKYEDGVVTLHYTHGEVCPHNNQPRESTIEFVCSHVEEKPTFINESDCSYLFNWPTPVVCPPVQTIQCTAQDSQGHNYDLTPLSYPSTNVQASVKGDTGGQYFINVCRTLLHTKGQVCPPNSAACLKVGENAFVNLGELSSPPTFVEDKLTLVYSGGERCRSDPSQNYSTAVTFSCDPRAPVATTPVVTTTDAESCSVELEWVTRAACALEREQSTEPCRVTSPTGHVFDLSSLKSDSYYDVTTQDGNTFHMNVCENVKEDKCGDNSGNCLHRPNGSSTSAGLSNQDLMYNDGALVLTYGGGGVCEADTNHQYSTELSFICKRSNELFLSQPDTPALKPVYTGTNPDTCQYYFAWHTNLACEHTFPCAVAYPLLGQDKFRQGHIFDLSTLVSQEGHYVVLSDLVGTQTSYFINICRPLEPIYDVHCPPGAAVCAVGHDSPPESLGFVDPDTNQLKYDLDTDHIVLQYSSNRACDRNVNANVSTKVVFTCQPGTIKGTPRLMEITSNCEYVFEFPTSIVCPQSTTAPTDYCSYTDHSVGHTYDFSSLKTLELGDDSGTFHVSPCAVTGRHGCDGAPVCRTDESGHSVVLGARKEVGSGATPSVPVEIVFSEGGRCGEGDEKSKTTILLICDREDKQKPSISHPSGGCNFVVNWPTSVVCPPLEKPCLATDPDSGATFDLTHLSSISHSWLVKDHGKNSYYINLCRPITPLHGCKEDATVCRVDSAGKSHNLGLLPSQSLTASTGEVTASYKMGDPGLCGNNFLASVEIKFICGHSLNSNPQFERLSEQDCVFHFTWTNRIACKVQPHKVNIGGNGILVDPKTGESIDLSGVLNKTWITDQEARVSNKELSIYKYGINFHGNADFHDLGNNLECGRGTAVCQYKTQTGFSRKIAEIGENSPSYLMADDSLEVEFTSNDICGKDRTKKSHVLLSMHCDYYSDESRPRFMYESSECGYIFQWFTNLMCPARQPEPEPTTDQNKQPVVSNQNLTATQQRPHSSVATVAWIFVTLGVVFALVLYKKERRLKIKRTVAAHLCGKCLGDGYKYRYIPSGRGILDDEEGTSLFDDDDGHCDVMHEETSLLATTSRLHGSGINDQPVFAPPMDVATTTPGDPFVPEVKVKSSRKSLNPFEQSDDSDVIIKDEEDEDLLEG